MAVTTNVRAMVHRGAWSSTTASEADFTVTDGTNTFTDSGYRIGNVVTHSNSQWMVIVPKAGTAQPSSTNTDYVRVDGSGGGTIPPTTVTTAFDTTSRVLTTTVDGVSDTVTIPAGTSTPPATTFTMNFDETSRVLTAVVNGITQTVTIPGGGGGTTPTSFLGGLSGQLSGAQSFIGSAFPARTVTVSATRGTLATSNPFTVTGITPSASTATSFTYTPNNTFNNGNNHSFSVEIRGTGTDSTTGMNTVNVSHNFYYPFFYGASLSEPTSTMTLTASENSWSLGDMFTITRSAEGQRLYIAIRASVATSPAITITGFQTTGSMVGTFNAGSRDGTTETYNVYDFGILGVSSALVTVDSI